MDLSRRSFLLASSGLASSGLAVADALAQTPAQAPAQTPTTPATAGATANGALTAAVVLDRIKANIGMPWLTETVDRIVAGTPETRVTGIATTMMATLEVLQRAAAAGRNMVITHESTFFSHQDNVEALLADPTYKFKLDFIQKHDMVVLHLHDHWHRRKPDGIAMGMAREVGWEKFLIPPSVREFAFTDRTLLQLARELESRLQARTMRVLGDPAMMVSKAIASWGFISQLPAIPYLARPDIDLLICGETREWETVEYVQDQIASGVKKKALIVLGHVVSEQAGMKLCAEWLRPIVSEVPVELIAADEPFWRTESPVAPRPSPSKG